MGGLGYFLLSRTGALWHLYAGFALIAVNTSTTWTPIIATISRWFDEKRVLALGIVTGGIGLGQMLMPPLAAYLIEATGWRTAYIIIAAITWLVVIPAAIPARHSPQSVTLPADKNTSVYNEDESLLPITEWSLAEAVRTRAFWLLVALNVTLAATLFMAGIHIAAYATDVGITPTSAALVITCMGGANILSKIIVGGVSAKRGTRFAVFLFLGIETVALFAFAATRELWMFLIVAMLFGVGIGGAAPPLAAMVAEFFGLRSVGIIMGVIGVGWAAGCSLGTLLGDYIFDTAGSYVPAFLITGGLAVITLVLVLLLRKPRKNQEA